MKRMILALSFLSTAGLFGMDNTVTQAFKHRLAVANNQISFQKTLRVPEFTELQAHANGLSIIKTQIDAQIPAHEGPEVRRKWETALLNLQLAFNKFSQINPILCLNWIISELTTLDAYASNYPNVNSTNQIMIRNVHEVLNALAQGIIEELHTEVTLHEYFTYINQLLTSVSHHSAFSRTQEYE